MTIKHSTVHNPNELIPSADWNTDHTGTATPEAHTAASHSDITSTGAQIDDAVSKKHTQNTDTALGAQTQNLDMNTHKIVGVVDPTANQEAATKKYVDDSIPGVGTSYWSCPAANFTATEPDTDDVDIGEHAFEISATTTHLLAPVLLPQGAVVTGVIVYGNVGAEGEIYMLQRITLLTSNPSVMGTANVNTEDTSIGNATIDNSIYGYVLSIINLDAGDQIYGARVTYTL